MADSVSEQWAYPPNWDGNPPSKNGWRRVVKMIRCLSDGTGESDVIKLDISELKCLNGSVPTRTAIEFISYSIKDIDSVVLEWDRAEREKIAVLPGNSDGEFDFMKFGGLIDPGEAGDRTGDILLTSNGCSVNGVYNILIAVRLKER